MNSQDIEYSQARKQKDKTMRALRHYEQKHPTVNPNAVEYMTETYELLLDEDRKASELLEDIKKRLGK